MAKRRRRGKRKEPFKLKLKKDTLYSISSTLLLVIGGLILLSFTRQGSLLTALHRLIFTFFGWGGIFLPFLFIASGLMLAKLTWGFTRPNVFIGGTVLTISLVGLTRAGLVGKEIWESLAALLTKFGAGIILIGGASIGFLEMFETSLADMLLFWEKMIRQAGKIFSRKPKWQMPNVAVKDRLGQMDLNQAKKKDEKTKGVGKEKEENKKTKPDIVGLDDKTLINVPGAAVQVWESPPISLLTDSFGEKADRGDCKKNADIIEQTLESFGIEARVVDVNFGPAVTQYALEIAVGTKLSKITALTNDLALALAAPTGQIRIEAPIPGRSLVGVEIPNHSLEIVPLKKMLESDTMRKAKPKLTVALGLDVSGEPVVVDIGRMPHVLIAGATGSGKSVCINSFISSLLFRCSPTEVKLILVDPKRVELAQYNAIPHLLTPVIVEPDRVISALRWTINEMEHRYKQFAEAGMRNIEGFNEASGFQALPYLVIIVDELADIILFAPSEVEDLITRLAQMARATGIHLVLATQRPSVDVITGLIKANIPCRIAFNVSSMIDSRVILDMPGAEKLLGKGDMLYVPPEQAKPTRIQGAFVPDGDVKKLIEYLRNSGVQPQYTEEVTTKYQATTIGGRGTVSEDVDELFEEAVRIICQDDKASASLLQRRLSIGYARAARILDQLHEARVVSAPEGAKPRDVLIQNAEEFLSQWQTAKERES